jgi:cell division initiation protein
VSYTPVELKHVRVGRRLLGYHRASVEQILNEVAESFETVWRDRGELADKVELLEQQLEELKRREQVLTDTLVAAERAAAEMKERAKHEAELIVAEAHGEARSILRSGQGERERLSAEVRRIEALLRSALGLVVEVGEVDAPAVAAEPARLEPAVSEPAAIPEQRTLAEVPEQATAPSLEPEPEAEPEAWENPREFQPVGAAPTPEPPEPESAEHPAQETDETAFDEQPGWPPLRRVAQGSSHFDWGD